MTEEEGFLGVALAQVGNFFSGLFGIGEGSSSCLSWWLLLILVLYSLSKFVRAWGNTKKEALAWLVWTVILILATLCFYSNTCSCLTIWIFLFFGLITYLIRWVFSEKEEKKKKKK